MSSDRPYVSCISLWYLASAPLQPWIVIAVGFGVEGRRVSFPSLFHGYVVTHATLFKSHGLVLVSNEFS